MQPYSLLFRKKHDNGEYRMIADQNLKSGYDMLYLAACAVNRIIPDAEKISAIDTGTLLKMSRFHSLGAICAYALESAGVTEPEFEKEKNLAVRKVLLLDAERKQILRFFEENQIWYMPLKGVYLKNYYPKTGMRQMCDNDILVDSARMDDIDEFMTSVGYRLHSPKAANDWGYLKEPVYNFEIHRTLFTSYHEKEWEDYYRDVKSKLIKNEGSEYGYHFSDEDFYIYITTHEYKHYTGGGTGLRSLLDCYVYLKKHDSMDWKYISEECEKLCIHEFESASRNLAQKIFSSPDFPVLDDEEKKMLEYILFSGTYGTTENSTVNRIEKFAASTGSDSRFRYIMHRIFPPMETYKNFFPFFYKHRILLPIGWLYRLLRGIFVRNKLIMGEIKVLRKR